MTCLTFAFLSCLFYCCAQPDTVIRKRLEMLDTTLTSEEILSQTIAFQKAAAYNPGRLDKMAKKMYKYNESGKYKNALLTGKKILKVTPNNITALKECSFAFSRLQQKDSTKLYFTMMVKCIEAAQSSGDGSYISPYLLNNSFELTSIMEASYRLYPKTSAILKDSKNRIVVFDKIGDIALFAQLDHWAGYLKKGEYIEVDLPGPDEQQKEMQRLIERFKK